MNCTCFLVKPGHNDGWLIEGGRRDMGPYHSRDLALQVAVSECLAMRRGGGPPAGRRAARPRAARHTPNK